MEGLFGTIQKALTDQAIGAIADKVGIPKQKGGDIANGVMGLLFDKMANNASKDSTEAQALQQAVEQHDGGILDNITGALSDGKIDMQDGAKILGHLFKGQDTSKIADTLAQQTGEDKNSIFDMMKYLAPVALSALNKGKGNTGGIGDMISMLTQGGKAANNKSSIAGSIITGLLDQDGDGDLDIADAVAVVTGSNKKRKGGLLSGLLGGIFGSKKA